MSKKYGCFNRKDFEKEVSVQNGWHYVGETKVPLLQWIPFVMAMDCQYRLTTLGQTDPMCDGCERK